MRLRYYKEPLLIHLYKKAVCWYYGHDIYYDCVGGPEYKCCARCAWVDEQIVVDLTAKTLER